MKDKINLQSQLELMKQDSEFDGSIVFHNLKSEELGALLWSLHLGHENSNCCHSLGHGKPLGAGAVKFSVSALKKQSNQLNGQCDQLSTFIDLFIEHMDQAHPNSLEDSWKDSPQIKHLLGFSNIVNNKDKLLSYMPLQSGRNSTAISYSSSIQGRRKHVLPQWQDNNQSLTRNEELNSNNEVPTSFGQGRLASLLKHKDLLGQLNPFEAVLRDSVISRQKATQLASLPKEERLFLALKDKLAPFSNSDKLQSKEGRQSCNSNVEKIIDASLSKELGSKFIKEFYQLVKNKKLCPYLDLAISKKNKIKLKERKTKLAEMAVKYDIPEA
jgi:hypothetical protein